MKNQFLDNFLQSQQLPASFIKTAQDVFIPLADKLAIHAQPLEKPFFIGINGCQGSGKSTLAAFLNQYFFTTKKLNVVSFSLDDFYLTKAQREALAHSVHPLFSTRGVPGTHNIEQLKQVLLNLQAQHTPISIPRFDKAIDDVYEENQWQCIKKPVDIVIIEGWCWGVSAQSPEALLKPINSLEKTRDSTAIWRSYVNQQLEQYYQPLYALMNTWIAIQAPHFDCVFQWRMEQENKLAARTNSSENQLMSAKDIAHFILYFERLTREALEQMPEFAKYLLALDENRDVKSFKVLA